MEKSIIWKVERVSWRDKGIITPSLTECKLLFQIKFFSLNHFSSHKCPEFSIINNGRRWVGGGGGGERATLCWIF